MYRNFGDFYEHENYGTNIFLKKLVLDAKIEPSIIKVCEELQNVKKAVHQLFIFYYNLSKNLVYISIWLVNYKLIKLFLVLN